MSVKYRNDQVGSEEQGAAWGHGLADTVMGAVRKRLGFEHCRFFLTGAAPIAKEVIDYFGVCARCHGGRG
jgi:long-subunit acyl-CoA synthetase (AMP-forming)